LVQLLPRKFHTCVVPKIYLHENKLFVQRVTPLERHHRKPKLANDDVNNKITAAYNPTL